MKKEIEKLKAEFVSLETEKQRQEFSKRFRHIVESKTETERKAYAKAFAESAADEIKRADALLGYTELRLKLEPIMEVVSLSYIAKTYFRKSRSWLSQRLNGHLVNGIPASFTSDELKTLSDALFDIGSRVQKTAHSI
ncbi:MAG: DUF5053 domain-containing protein [Mangrovibacterium sp.]